MEYDVSRILGQVYGVRGLPFPQKPTVDNGNPIADAFPELPEIADKRFSQMGTRMWGKNVLGRPVFMPAKIDGLELPNPLITITGEKEIVETVLVDVGTVFERVFTRPYNVSIILTLIAENDVWPEAQVREIVALWKKDDVVTIDCVLTDLFLKYRDNLIITNISLLDMQGVENAQVIEINGRSNIEFELELKPE